MLFDKLIERVGWEATPNGTWWPGSLAGPGQHVAPLATAITNTMINTSQLISSPNSNQSVVAAPHAVATGNNNEVSNSNSSRSSSSSKVTGSSSQGSWLGLGNVAAVFLFVFSLAGKVLRVAAVVVLFFKNLAMQLLLLKAVAATAKGLAASDAPQLQLAGAPRPAGAAGRTAVPAARHQPAAARPTPAAAGQPLKDVAVQEWPPLSPAATETATSASAGGLTGSSSAAFGSLGLLSAVPVMSGIRVDCKQAAQLQLQQQDIQSQHQQQQQRPQLQQQHQPKPQEKQQAQLGGRQTGELCSRQAMLRRPRRQAHVRGSDQLLYQLWAPEAARA